MTAARSALRRRSLLLGLAGAALEIGTARADAPPDALTDLMPPFWHAYDEIPPALPAAQRAARLIAAYFEPSASSYRRAGMGAVAEPSIAKWLASFDPLAPHVRALHERFAVTLGSHLGRFRDAFADFDAGASPIVLLPSLFRFDAHLEPDGASLPLFFGPDGIVRYHGADADLGVLFAHEIFHCYQAQKNPALSLDPHAPVYASLWIEGVATWVSERMNPRASLLHVLLDDEALYRRGPDVVRPVARTLLDRLDSRADADQALFFSAGTTADGSGWPGRAGYYVGLLAARRIGERMSPAAMAALPAADVRANLVRELTELTRG